MESIIISVIGTPGVGKSFLVEKLANKLGAISILEEGKEIPERILENFKNESRQMETIIWFRNKLIEDMKKSLELKKQGNLIVMDTCLISNELHITTMTSGFEQEILLKQAQFDREHMPQPDVVIFLDASEETVRKLTEKRGRDYDTNEKFIQRNLSIKKAHDDYFNENKDSLIHINRDNLDFEKEEDLQKVIDIIKNRTI